jgi:predicted enzyme related to lactoylglutathione lyase
MPTRDTAPIGSPCWVDLMSSDTARSREFYSQLLGWQAEEPNEAFGGYFNFTLNGKREAGCMASQPGQGPSDVWSVYLAVEDAAKTVEVAVANGATVIAPAMQVGDLGAMAVVADPTGAAIGMWQPGTHKGFGYVAESGAPGWFELHTSDHDGAVAFYREVFGWETQPMEDPQMRYTMKMGPAGPEAGIMDASATLIEGMASYWSVYFGVDDADAALAKVTELGGAVVTPVDNTPNGNLATVTDANGALFRIVAPNERMPAAG